MNNNEDCLNENVQPESSLFGRYITSTAISQGSGIFFSDSDAEFENTYDGTNANLEYIIAHAIPVTRQVRQNRQYRENTIIQDRENAMIPKENYPQLSENYRDGVVDVSEPPQTDPAVLQRRNQIQPGLMQRIRNHENIQQPPDTPQITPISPALVPRLHPSNIGPVVNSPVVFPMAMRSLPSQIMPNNEPSRIPPPTENQISESFYNLEYHSDSDSDRTLVEDDYQSLPGRGLTTFDNFRRIRAYLGRRHI